MSFIELFLEMFLIQRALFWIMVAVDDSCDGNILG